MDPFQRKNAVCFLVLLFFSGLLSAELRIQTDRSTPNPPLVNWRAPATYTPSRTRLGTLDTQSEIAGPFAFIPVTPCRQYDSRSFTPLVDGIARVVTLVGAPCGIPPGPYAISLNITVFNIVGATGNGVFKIGISSPPTSAWINYPPTETQRGNAGVTPLNSSDIVVQVNQGGGHVDFTVDVNGYYYDGNYGGAQLPNGFFFQINGSVVGEGMILGSNISPGLAYGVRGYAGSTAAGSAGVFGQGGSGAANTAGVMGVLSGGFAGAAGVYGTDNMTASTGSGGVDASAGVYGASPAGYGVLGVSRNVGIKGVFLDGGGNFQTAGELGMSSTVGVYSIGNFVATGMKTFVDPHPYDASKAIAYVALEGPESGTYFRGSAHIENGLAVIPVPEDFRLVTDTEGLTVQLTPVGAAASIYVVSEGLDQIVVRSNRDVKFHYMVNGVRRAFKDHKPIVENDFFRPESPQSKMPGAFSAEQKRILLQTGIYNADGSVNLETAKHLGWDRIWNDGRRPVPKPE